MHSLAETKDEGQAGFRATHCCHKLTAAGIFEHFLRAIFQHDEHAGDIVFVEEWFHHRVVKDGFQPPTPPSPRGTEVDKDCLFLLAGRRHGTCHYLFGGFGSHCRRCRFFLFEHESSSRRFIREKSLETLFPLCPALEECFNRRKI